VYASIPDAGGAVREPSARMRGARCLARFTIVVVGLAAGAVLLAGLVKAAEPPDAADRPPPSRCSH
jgi:hypothetical protein